MVPSNVILWGAVIGAVAGTIYLARNKSTPAPAPAPDTVVIDRSGFEFPDIPWQNKLPGELTPAQYVMDFGSININRAGSYFGDVTVNIPITQDAGSCSMCSASLETTKPLLPYSPPMQASSMQMQADNSQEAIYFEMTGNNTVTPLLNMAGL